MKKLYYQISCVSFLALVMLWTTLSQANGQNVTINPAQIEPGVFAPKAGGIGQDSYGNILSVFLIGNANATLNSITVTTSGTYTTDDIPNGFTLRRGNINNSSFYNINGAEFISSVPAVASGGNIVFSGLSESINEFDGSIYYITVDIAQDADLGKTISLTATPSSNFVFASGATVTTSTLPATSTQTISPKLYVYGSMEDQNVSAGSTALTIYRFSIGTNELPAELKALTVKTKGSYTLSDLNIGGFQLWKRNDNGEESLIQSIPAVASGGNLVFTGLSEQLGTNDYSEFYIRVNLSSNAVLGHTIGITETPFANLTFDQLFASSNSNLMNEGGYATIAVPTITIGSANVPNGVVSPGSVSNVVYKLKVISENSGAAFSQIIFKTTGNYQTSDIATGGFKIYGGDEDEIEILLSSVNAVASGGNLVFTLPNVAIREGDEVYVYLTADLSASAVVGRTLGIQAVASGDITSVTGTITGAGLASGTQTITNTAVAFTAMGPASGTVSPGTMAVLHTVKVDVSGATATFNGATFQLTGTYQLSDIDNSEAAFILAYHKSPNIMDDIEGEGEAFVVSMNNIIPSSGNSLSFPFMAYNPDAEISPILPVGTGYLTVLVNIAETAVLGRTIQLSSAGTAGYVLGSGLKSGTTGTGGVQTIGSPNVAISTETTPASAVSPGTNQVLYRIKLDVTNATAVLKSLTLTTAGTYQNSDIQQFRLYRSLDNVFAMDYNDNNSDWTIAQTSTVSSGSSLTFTDIEYDEIIAGETRYLFVVAVINSNATPGKTINITATPTSAFTFIAANISGTSPLPAGGVQTITAPTSIALTFPAVAASDIEAGSENNVIYRFNVAPQGANAVLNNFQFTTDGDYLISDIQNGGFKLWYNTTNSFAGSIQVSSASVQQSGSMVYAWGNNTSIPVGSIGYFFVTVDLLETAVANGTISVEAVSASNFQFAASTPTGSGAAGGVQTIVAPTGLFGKVIVSKTVVYPNPSSSNSVVTINTDNANSKLVTVYNSTGGVISSSNTSQKIFYLENLEKGMYMISIQDLNKNTIEMNKVVVE